MLRLGSGFDSEHYSNYAFALGVLRVRHKATGARVPLSSRMMTFVPLARLNSLIPALSHSALGAWDVCRVADVVQRSLMKRF